MPLLIERARLDALSAGEYFVAYAPAADAREVAFLLRRASARRRRTNAP